MRMRFGLMLGLAIGYVLGAKAGRERYEQIRSMWASVSASEPAQQIGAEMRSAAARASDAIEQKAAAGVSRVTGMMHSDDPNGTSPPPI